MKQLTTRQITLMVLGVGIVGWIGWDIYVALTPEQGDTISEVVLSWSTRVALIPLTLGTLMGHLLWPHKQPKYRIELLVLAAILVGTRDVCAWVWDAPEDVLVTWILHTVWFPLVPFLAGVPLGHYAWPQGPEDAEIPPKTGS